MKEIKIWQEGPLFWLELNAPQTRNAISEQMIEEFCQAFNMAKSSLQTKVVIICGSGKSFCAGGNIKQMKKKEGMFAGDPFELSQRYMEGIQRIPKEMASFSKPVIAMINGPAVGAGCDLALMCDLRVVGPSAQFGETFSKLGLVPGIGGTYFLPRLVGYAKACEILLTGKMIGHKQAYDLGMANRVVEDEQDLIRVTKEFALEIAKNPSAAIELTKQALRVSLQQDLYTHLEMLAAYQGIVQNRKEHFDALDEILK